MTTESELGPGRGAMMPPSRRSRRLGGRRFFTALACRAWRFNVAGKAIADQTAKQRRGPFFFYEWPECCGRVVVWRLDDDTFT